MKNTNNSSALSAPLQIELLADGLRRVIPVWSEWDNDQQRRVLPGRFRTELNYALELVSPVRSHRYHVSTPQDAMDRFLSLLGDLQHPDKGDRDWAYQLGRLDSLCGEACYEMESMRARAAAILD